MLGLKDKQFAAVKYNCNHYTNEQLVSIPIYRIPFSLIMYLFAFLIALSFKYKKFKINILDNFDTKNKHIIMSNFLFGILYLVIQMLLIFNYTDILPLTYTFFNFRSFIKTTNKKSSHSDLNLAFFICNYLL